MAKKLKIGDEAPTLKGKPVNMKDTFDLSVAIQDKPVVVVFSRYFGCPVCQANFDSLLDAKEEIAKKADIVYVIQSSQEMVEKFIANKEGVDFPILCDPDKPYPLYSGWGVGKMGLSTLIKVMKLVKSGGYKHGEYEGDELRTPADFIIGKNGKVIRSNYSILDVAGILDALSNM